MPQFDHSFFFSQLFWMLICFGVLFSSIYFWILPSFTKINAKRNAKIESIAKKTATLLKETEKLAKQNEEAILSARAEAQTIIDAASLQSQEKYTQYKNEITAVFDKKMQEAMDVMEKEKDDAVRYAKKEGEELAKIILSKYSGRATRGGRK